MNVRTRLRVNGSQGTVRAMQRVGGLRMWREWPSDESLPGEVFPRTRAQCGAQLLLLLLMLLPSHAGH